MASRTDRHIKKKTANRTSTDRNWYGNAFGMPKFETEKKSAKIGDKSLRASVNKKRKK